MLVRFVLSVNGLEIAAYEPERIVLNIDPDLLSGFLEAMESFGDEMKHPIQEIRFSNWIIYINKNSDFTIRLIMTNIIMRTIIDEVFAKLRKIATEILPNYLGGRCIQPQTINELFVPVLKAIINEKVGTSDDNVKQLTPADITSHISLVGLGDVGKTSIKKYFLDYVNLDEALKTKPTLEIENTKNKIAFLNETVNIQEFGGQAAFRQKYLTNKLVWKNISTLIYVVDLQKPELFTESCNYLHSIMSLMAELNKTPFNLCLFFHKYDPLLRESLAKNLRQCLKIFAEFQDKSTIHLTSLLDSSSNIAMIKSIYLGLPAMMLQKMLEEEFLKDIKSTLMPRYIPLISDPTSPINDDLAEEIKMSAVMYGRSYGYKFQDAWIRFLSGEIITTPQPESNAIIVKKVSLGIHVTLKKDRAYPNLYSLVVFGALLGMTRNLQFQSPKIVNQNEAEITWHIQF